MLSLHRLVLYDTAAPATYQAESDPQELALFSRLPYFLNHAPALGLAEELPTRTDSSLLGVYDHIASFQALDLMPTSQS